ncbi:uncharacterized protein LOC135693152 [Rhopilema esculentum]|uniref:uncharacterized protein LOC135693152 n=1 Tax=Rhopilema esculentum TaxID=499914 RepID=UPI0031DEC41C
MTSKTTLLSFTRHHLLSKHFRSFGTLSCGVNREFQRDISFQSCALQPGTFVRSVSSSTTVFKSHGNLDIEQAVLRYTRYKGKRPNLKDLAKETGPEYADLQVRVADARSIEPTIEEYGFQLIKHQTELKRNDFSFTNETLINWYFDEVKEAVKKIFPDASDIKLIQHQVRQSIPVTPQVHKANDSDFSNCEPRGSQILGAQPPAALVHSDFTPYSAMKTFSQITKRELRKGRFIIVSVWRNISDKWSIQNDHLGLCDVRSVKAPDDFVVADSGSGNATHELYVLEPGRHKSHQWFYFPNMVKDEVLIFKLYDSDCDEASRFVFHSSFRDPNASSTAQPRESVECRCIVFFPDHEPNTIPVDVESKQKEDLVGLAVEKIMEALMFAQYWPAIRRLGMGAALYRDDGVSFVLRQMVNGFVKLQLYGLESASQEQLEEIIERCLSGGLFEKTAKANFNKVPLEDAVIPIVMAHVESPANWSEEDRSQIKLILNEDKGLTNIAKKCITDAVKEAFGELNEKELNDIVSKLVTNEEFKKKVEALLQS